MIFGDFSVISEPILQGPFSIQILTAVKNSQILQNLDNLTCNKILELV